MRRIAATVLVCLLIWSRVDAQAAVAAPAATAPASLVLVRVLDEAPAGARPVVVRRELQGAALGRAGSQSRGDGGRIAGGALKGGLLGAGIGGLAGVAVGASGSGEYASLAALVLGGLGAYAGASVGIPLGAARACRHGGAGDCSVAGPLVGSLAVGGMAAALILSDEEALMPYAAAVPFVQIGLSVVLVR